MMTEEEYEITVAGAELTRELREAAQQRGINPLTATDAELLPLVELLPQEIIQDAKDISEAMGFEREQVEQTLASFIRIMFETDEKPALLN